MAGCGHGTVIGSGPLPTPTPVVPRVSNEFAVASNSQPMGITVGPDAFIYFTEQGVANGAPKIGKISTGGSLTEIAVTPATAQPFGIVRGPDNLLWFTEMGADTIVSMTTASGNAMTSYPLGTPPGGAASWKPAFITTGPGTGSLFFTAPGANAIGEITTSGAISSFLIPTAGSNPQGLVTGPDLNVWFVENAASKIGRLNVTTGTITEFPTPTANAGPTAIVLGPDGALWFTENNVAKLGRITTTGVTTDFALASAGSASGLVVGADANFYFGDPVQNQFGRAIISGAFENTMFSIPAANAQPSVFILGPDQRIYFTETAAAKIGQISYF
jgi:virginiamycin B lyase